VIPQESVTLPRVSAYEIKNELKKWLNRHSAGRAGHLRWSILEELRFGMGYDGRDTRAAAKLLRSPQLSPTERDALRDRLAEAQFDPADNPESRIDLFAIDCWPGKAGKHERLAFEIKVDKTDLAAELKNPAKRAPWLSVVNRFFIVVPEGLATAGLIEDRAPECGLIVYGRRPERPDTAICSCNNKHTDVQWHHSYGCDFKDAVRAYERGRQLNEVRPAMQLDGGEPSWGLVASILRRVS
jgi:hypothetical protein